MNTPEGGYPQALGRRPRRSHRFARPAGSRPLSGREPGSAYPGGLVARSAWLELGHELAVGDAGCGEVVVAFLEFQFQVDRLLLKGGDPGLELLGVVGAADAHLAPDLLAERFADALFEAADLGDEAGGAGVLQLRGRP
uniref:hypothetical protein n=1 Tax=Streptomyces sp. NBC_01592 TaxID=2975889 RepID=UPI002F91AD5C